MKTGAIVATIAGVFLSFMILVGVAGFSIVSSAYTKATKSEVNIKYSFKDLENVKSNYTLKIKEMAQVPDMYADKLKEVVTAAISGRYGANGSKAVFQMITEQNPTVDPAMFNRLQQVMEAGRNDFSVAQTKHIDQLRSYETLLTANMVEAFLYRLIGFPKLDLSKYQVIVSSDTKRQFDTGVDEKINLKDNK